MIVVRVKHLKLKKNKKHLGKGDLDNLPDDIQTELVLNIFKNIGLSCTGIASHLTWHENRQPHVDYVNVLPDIPEGYVSFEIKFAGQKPDWRRTSERNKTKSFSCLFKSYFQDFSKAFFCESHTHARAHTYIMKK